MTQEISRSTRGPEAGPGWLSKFKALFRYRTLSECAESGRDNILLLRLLAALMVVFGHSCVLLGASHANDDPLHVLLPGTATHLVGVMMFFMISGFLITLSYQRTPHLLRFVRARLLRLWPALIVSVFACAFVLGPLLTTLSLREYFSSTAPLGTPWTFFATNLLFVPPIRPFLPGVLAGNPTAQFVNASLWTIPYEAKMYLCVAIVGVFGFLRRPWLLSAFIAAVYTKIVLWPLCLGMVKPSVAFFGIVLTGFFGAGAIACLLRKYVPISTGLMLLLACACVLTRLWVHSAPVMWLTVGYFVLWFAYVPRLPSIPHDWDLSYGTYLWAFPITQIVIAAGVRNAYLVFAIVLPIVLVVALGSWLLVEKPALKLKDFRLARTKFVKPADAPT